jgi:hypothetical protein
MKPWGVLLRVSGCAMQLEDQQNQTLDQSDDNETGLHVTYASHFHMDDAFCARMRAAIAAGLETATIGVVTTPGTKYPKQIPTEPRPLVSSQRDMELA